MDAQRVYIFLQQAVLGEKTRSPALDTLLTRTSRNWLCVSIAINLMLTIAFGLNTVKLRMLSSLLEDKFLQLTRRRRVDLERWYYTISLALGLLGPIIPAAQGHFGLDPDYQVW